MNDAVVTHHPSGVDVGSPTTSAGPSSATSSHHPSAFSHATNARTSMSSAPSSSSHANSKWQSESMDLGRPIGAENGGQAMPSSGAGGSHQIYDSIAGPSRQRQASTLSQSSSTAPPISPRSTSLAHTDKLRNGPEVPDYVSEQHASGSGSGNGSGMPDSNGSGKAPRIPSRQLLQSALDLAQKAVEMDQGNDVVGALAAYREAVSRLRAVMERVGGESDGKRRRSGKAEEEGRTLRGIHDAYVARIQLLSSYEHAEVVAGADQADQGHVMTHPYAGASTSTLVPSRSQRTSVPRGATPSSMDEHGGTAIGEFMMTSRSSGSIHRSDVSSSGAGIETLTEEGATNMRIPPRRESLNGGIGLGYPISPPRLESAQSNRSSNGSPSTPYTPRRTRIRQTSMGLEDEAGLTAADGLLNVEELEEVDHAEKSLPPTPISSPAEVAAIPGKGQGHIRTSSFGRIGQLISASTSQGTISQRRQKAPTTSNVAIGSPDMDNGLPSSKSLMPSSSRSHLPAAQLEPLPPRSRSKSQPGHRPGEPYQVESTDDVPPLPNLRNKPSFPSRRIRIPSDSLAPPVSLSLRSVSPASSTRQKLGSPSLSSSLISPVPEIQPQEVVHRAFHLLRSIRLSMDTDGPGAYLTGSIHVPSAVWNPSAYSRGGAKLPGPKIVAQDVKIRAIDQILLHMEILRHTGGVLLDGPKEVNFGVPGVAAPRIGAGKCQQAAEELKGVLETFEEEMEGVYKSLVKGGVSVGAWKGKKTSNAMSWGSKMARSMDKMSGSKGLDSPDKYVDILAALCSAVQIIDAHLINFTGPCTPAYHAISEEAYRNLENRVLRAAEFVKVVITPVVLDDFKQFFHRYLKAGMRYIED